MSLKNTVHNIIFNIEENYRKKIFNAFNDYEEYIKREKELLQIETSEEKRLYIILNIAEAYYNNGNYNKAIKLIHLLDDYELNDNLTFIYYANLLLYYISINDEESVDFIFNESENIMKKYNDKYPEFVDIYNISYFNFKGRYEESIDILKCNRIKNKDTDFYNLLMADIAFNTNEKEQGIYILSEMCKSYYQKFPCIQAKIDILINTYLSNICIEKCGQDNNSSFEIKMWNKVKFSRGKTFLLFAYMELLKLFKKKWFIYTVLPLIISLFLTKILIPIILGDLFKDVLINIVVFIVLLYYLLGLGHLGIKYKEQINSSNKYAILITFIIVNIVMGFFVLDVPNNIRDVKYAISKTDVHDSGIIKNVVTDNEKKDSAIEIKINNNIFTIYKNDKLYDYIKSNLKKGNKVNFEYLPNSMRLIKIEKQ